MYLSSVEIIGFKSFAQRVKLQFDSGITAIVGPNGCGKTNIVDAIRWALGEQRYSMLRTDRMEDVIFNGTRLKKPLGMAEVSLTIQNTKNILPIEYSEVTVTRRVFRSGESEYLLNGSLCRLKDILDLFMDTGMAADAYSVIELKMVETILSDQADERRRLFEEAAGVTRYKHRRKAAYRKLESVRQDLIRVNDLIAEVKKKVNSLERQAKRAEEYNELSQRLRGLEIALMAMDLYQTFADIAPLEEQRSALLDRKKGVEETLKEEDDHLEEARSRFSVAEEARRSAQSEVEERREALHRNEQMKLVAAERLRALGERISTLEGELKRLEEQRQRAEEELAHLSAAVAEIEAHLKESQHALEREKSSLASISTSLQAKKIALEEHQTMLRKQEQVCSGLERELDQVEARRLSVEERISSLEEAIRRSELSLAEIDGRIRDRSARDKQIRLTLAELELSLAQAERQRAELERAIEALQSRERDALHALKANEERIALLKAFLEQGEGIPEGTKFLIEHHGDSLLGTLGEILSTAEQYRVAVEAALGELVHGLIVNGGAQAEELIRQLREHEKGKALFLLLEEVPLLHRQHEVIQAHGVIGWLIDVVSCRQEYQPLVEALLDRYLLVRDFSAAVDIVHQYPDVRCVTLLGELLSSKGEIRAGSRRIDEGGLIGTKEQIRELEGRRTELEQGLTSIRTQLRNAQQALEAIEIGSLTEKRKAIEHEMMTIEVQLAQSEFEKQRMNESLGGLRDELGNLVSERRSLENLIAEQRQAFERQQENLSALRKTEKELVTEIHLIDDEYTRQSARVNEAALAFVSLKGDLQNIRLKQEHALRVITEAEHGIAQRASELNIAHEEENRTKSDLLSAEEAIAVCTQGLESAREHEQAAAAAAKLVADEIRAVEGKLREARRRHEEIVDELHDLDVRISELRMRGENLRIRAREEFEIELEPRSPADFAEGELDAVAVREEVATIKSKLRALGGVNFEAFSEFQQEKERLEFLISQRDDLLEAERTLLQTIEEINTTAQEKFLTTFEKIRENFALTFQSLFDEGDEADLRLEEGVDPLEAKIFIVAKPRGKRPQSIELLSQGEKTLTAIALLFAIYLVKPSPFCVLDEVDAPLDDANVSRFTRILKKFSDNTQFIVITHNKRTMEAANVLYGVTMEEEGISKVVSVRFRDEVLVQS